MNQPNPSGTPFPSWRLRVFMALYAVIWWLGLPLLIAYLFKRGRKDPLYKAFLSERFGRHHPRAAPHVWIHAVSLGEMRSAVPLVAAFLERGHHVVTTHFTPAGRREAERVFADAIAAGTLSAVWVPFDTGAAFRRFFAAFNPLCGLVMEVEFWPGMIMQARKAGIPLLLCNGQYPTRSFERDKHGNKWRGEIVRGFAGVMVKSDIQARRFESLGQHRTAVTGELRFEQPIPAAQLEKAPAARQHLAGARPVITIASAVEGEDATYAEAIHTLLKRHAPDDPARPFFILVPRAPERFDTVAEDLHASGLRIVRRSSCLTRDLAPASPVPAGTDLMVGDSLGEMYFYLAMADRVVVGGGFVPKGAHNIIEPLALRKPVLVGPEIWTIEYPAREAIEAGVLQVVGSETTLADALLKSLSEPPDDDRLQGFFEAQSGALKRTMEALPQLSGRTF